MANIIACVLLEIIVFFSKSTKYVSTGFIPHCSNRLKLNRDSTDFSVMHLDELLLLTSDGIWRTKNESIADRLLIYQIVVDDLIAMMKEC